MTVTTNESRSTKTSLLKNLKWSYQSSNRKGLESPVHAPGDLQWSLRNDVKISSLVSSPIFQLVNSSFEISSDD